MNVLNTLIQGILLGGYYALLASGLSFLYGVMRIINLAHGSLAVLAAYVFWILLEHTGLNPSWFVLPLLVGMGALGWILHRLVFAPSMKGGALVPILSTFGLAIVTDNLMFQAFGADTRSLAPYIDALAYDSWELPGGIYVGQVAVLVFVLAIGVLGGLQLLLSHTAIGRQIWAAAEDPDAATLVGVNSHRVFGAASAIAMVLVGLAGISLGLRATFDTYAGGPQLVFAFEAVVMGGTGSLWGTLIGGVVLGVAQSVGAALNPQGFLIAGHCVFLVILLFRIYLSDRFRALLRTLRVQPS